MAVVVDCEIKFELICKTQFGESIWIVGNLPQLGLWDSTKGVLLKTDADNYPNWYTENPLMLPKGAKFQFKFVKMSNSGGEEWESFPNNLNRKYRARYVSVTLKAVWNDFSGREVATKKYGSSNIFSNNEIKVHKFKISGVFVPYEQACSNSSEGSEFGNNNNNNTNTNARGRKNSSQAGAKKIEEINDDKSKALSPSLDSDEASPHPRGKKIKRLPHGPSISTAQNTNNNTITLLLNDKNSTIRKNSNNNNNNSIFPVNENKQTKDIFETDATIKQNALQKLMLQGCASREKDEQNDRTDEVIMSQSEQLSSNSSSRNIKISQVMQPNFSQLQQQQLMQNSSNSSNKERINPPNINPSQAIQSDSQSNIEITQMKTLKPKQKGGKLLKNSSELQQHQSGAESDAEQSDSEGVSGNSNNVTPQLIQAQESSSKIQSSKKISPEIDQTGNLSLNAKTSGSAKGSQTAGTQQQSAGAIIIVGQGGSAAAGASSNPPTQTNVGFITATQTEESNTTTTGRSTDRSTPQQKLAPTQQEVLFAEKLFQSSGHTLQTLFQERLKKNSSRNIASQKYSFITSENDIVFEASEEFLVQMSGKDELCLATFFLPIVLTYDQATDTFKEEIQEQSLHYHFVNAYSSLRWVGVLPPPSNIPFHLRDRATTYLIQKHRFYPIFMEEELLENFLCQFCANMYDSVMTNQFDIEKYRCIEYDSKLIEEVKMVSFRFAQAISKVIDEDTNIIISDYKIIFSIIYLAQSRAKKLSIAYFHDGQFPDIEKLQLLPFGDKLINAILCSNLVSFINFEAAQNFLRFIRLKLKLPYESIRGSLRLIYMGNQIIIHIRNPGVNVRLMASLKQQPQYEDHCNLLLNISNATNSFNSNNLAANNLSPVHKEYFQQYQQQSPAGSKTKAGHFFTINESPTSGNSNTEIPVDNNTNMVSPGQDILAIPSVFRILSVDTLHENNKILLKLKLFQRFLQNFPEINAQLVQILLPHPNEYGTEEQQYGVELTRRINQSAEAVNSIFAENRNPVVIIQQNMSLRDRMCHMSISDMFLKLSAYGESEMYPLEFIVSNQRGGFSLLSKFSSASFKQMRSCVAFNPSSYSEFENAVLEIYKMPTALKEKVRFKDQELLSQFSTSSWLEKHIAELKKNAKFMQQANMTGFNRGINFKKVAHQANFKQLNVHEASDLYRKTVRRLLILGYAGTLVPFDKYMYIQAEEHQVRRHYQKPSEKIIDILKKLCADKRNMVYIVTELSIDFMDEWFADVKGLGLICENGYWHKVVQESGKHANDWVRLVELDMSWKEPVTRVMESYTIRTQGSSVEVKDSSVTWKYGRVSIDFGSKQAEQMMLQLSPLITQLKYLELSHHHETVEVRPNNLNKGMVAELLIERKIVECGKIDYILILGSSVTDEDMFCACQMFCRNRSREFQDVKLRPLYVTIGIKPSNAYYYISFEEVEKVLELLVLAESFASFS